ncbi:hypothetical protein BDQ17DRAFT_1422065 [Cyathus striatus]|nr:hypothetical protein BDQ17DRAFT_1422065 [Cyathus striatus]
MSAPQREIGTLIVVVLKAHIGKQDPYCLVTVNGEKRRTKAIKRGGQHPEWDEEIRFTLYEDTNDTSKRIVNESGSPPPPPPKDNKKPRKIQGGNTMKIACYADDPREPDLIGETDVDLTEVLTKGETDEWFDLTNKDKFAGKVYLELTFWSNEPPPEKKVTPKPSKGNKQYAGPGSFIAAGELPGPPRATGSLSRIDHSRQYSDIPSSLRASNSFASLDLYVPPYEQRHRATTVDQIAQEFSEFGISSQRQMESFPNGTRPPPHVNTGSMIGHSQASTPVVGFAEDLSVQSSFLSSPQGSGMVSVHSSSGYRQPYETHVPAPHPPPPSRGPRHSVPTSSGFIPLPSSGFSLFPSQQLDTTYAPLPTTSTYNTTLPQTPFVPPQQSSPLNTSSYTAQSLSTSFQGGPLSYQTSYQYHQPPSSVSPQSYIGSQPQSTASPQQYPNYPPASSPSHDHDSGNSQITSQPVSSATSVSSRPLPPEPQVLFSSSTSRVSHPLPVPPTPPNPPPASYSQVTSSPYPQASAYPPQQLFPPNTAYASVPPPPPLPASAHFIPEQQQYITPSTLHVGVPPPPPPPPPPQGAIPRRRASLPQPPVTYQQPIPPPPPPSDMVLHTQNQTYHSNSIPQSHFPPPPPPPPPPLPHHTEQTHWISLNNSVPVQDSYQGYS